MIYRWCNYSRLEISVDPERSAVPMGPQIYRFTDLSLTLAVPHLTFTYPAVLTQPRLES